MLFRSYFANLDTKLVTIGTPEGAIAPEDLAAVLTDDTACVLVQHPNFFGCLENVAELAELTHRLSATQEQVAVVARVAYGSLEPAAQALLRRLAVVAEFDRDLARELGIELLASTLHARLLEAGVAHGLGEWDNSAIIAVLRQDRVPHRAGEDPAPDVPEQ